MGSSWGRSRGSGTRAFASPSIWGEWIWQYGNGKYLIKGKHHLDSKALQVVWIKKSSRSYVDYQTRRSESLQVTTTEKWPDRLQNVAFTNKKKVNHFGFFPTSIICIAFINILESTPWGYSVIPHKLHEQLGNKELYICTKTQVLEERQNQTKEVKL